MFLFRSVTLDELLLDDVLRSGRSECLLILSLHDSPGALNPQNEDSETRIQKRGLRNYKQNRAVNSRPWK